MTAPVGFCPGCGTPLGDAGLVQEFWVADDRHFLCWCASCSLLSTVVLPAALISHEPEH
ncbi:hypothetical protein EV383_3980 [Pseudonocardia sediminis]|uniref:Uncharacterized protein n=1 Tax=Pseudonocardia sediminis TaxID=1397368 RepID=A0A4Q7V341_PSEST|nr:hypothetical protein [Pseudonocardia sediminis]RZT87073.1 hypothetical protein EV383_3980 [Pseudonocardia sediminis]